MKGLSIYGCIFASVLCGCSTSGPRNTSASWIDGEDPINRYVLEGVAEKIVVLFWVEGYDPIGAIYQKVISDNLEELGAEEYFFVKYNCDRSSSLGLREMGKLGIKYAPVVLVIDTATKEWKATSKNTVYWKSKEEILFDLKQVFKE